MITGLQAPGPAYVIPPRLGWTEWSSWPDGNHWHQPSAILLLGGGRENSVVFLLSLLPAGHEFSGIWSPLFPTCKGLLLGSRTNTDELVKEWGALGLQGHHEGLGLTLVFADHQTGPPLSELVFHKLGS